MGNSNSPVEEKKENNEEPAANVELKNSLSEQNIALLCTSKWTDCTFIVGDGDDIQAFPCHRLLLGRVSTVFEKMLFGPQAKTEVRLSAERVETFKTLLEFAYSGTVDLSSYELTLDVCVAADKYLISPLKRHCVDHLLSTMGPSTACSALEVARVLPDCEVLEQRAWTMILERTDEVLLADTFPGTSRETVLRIVQEGSLHVDSEAPLIAACLRWTEHEAERQGLDADTEGLRTALGDMLQHLRFLSLTGKEFADVAAKSNILTSEEKVILMSNIIVGENGSYDFIEGFSSIDTKRLIVDIKIPKFTFSNELNNSKNSTGIVCSSSFKVDCDVYLIGIQIAVPASDLRPKIVMKNSSGCCFQTGNISADSDCLRLQLPLLILKDERYTVFLASVSGECKLKKSDEIIGNNLFSDESQAVNPKESFITAIIYKKY